MRYAIAFGIALFVACTLEAPASTTGSIHGTVSDSSNGRPIAAAAVDLLSRSADYHTLTDAHGFYVIVGVEPGAYRLRVTAQGYREFSVAAVAVVQDSTATQDARLDPSALPPTIAVVSTRAASFPVQDTTTSDVTVVGTREQQQLGGIPGYENEGELLSMLPGVTGVGGAGNASGPLGTFPTIRGGLENDTGFQLEGINATDPLTGEPINNLLINGAENLRLTAGPGDASEGGSGSGFFNVVSKTGTYPASGEVQLETGGPAFEHNLHVEYGASTPDHRYSFYVSGIYDRDYGGCCSPPYGNVYGSPGGSYPDTLGQVSFSSTNDTVFNGFIHFGRNNANTIQLWGEWGANQIIGGDGIDASAYPFTTATPQYIGIYEEAPLFFNPLAAPLTSAQAQALMPFYPGQTSAYQAIGSLPAETTEYNLMKVAFSRAVGTRGYVNARLYRTQNYVVDASTDANDPLFGYGLPSIGFDDFYVTRASQNTGVAADLKYQIGDKNELSAGADYRFSRIDLEGTLPSPSLIFAGATIADFLPSDPFNGGAPGVFYGDRYPAFTETITDPMHRTSYYLSDLWSPRDGITIEPGVRYDMQTVPTAAGLYEANQFQPRIAAVLTLGKDRDTVLRASYGHATTFAPLFQIETIYTPPDSYKNDPATLPICGGPAASFSAPCPNYYDELYNAWWKGYGVNPYNLTKPQQSDSYDVSYEHEFTRAHTGLKVTYFTRRDYDVIVNEQQLAFNQGVVIPGTTAITNNGKAETNGMELQLVRQLGQGLSAIVDATYINQFVNYISSNAFRPSVEPALLASGQLFHPPYFTPLAMTGTLDYERNGWRIDPIVYYTRGYPVGLWGAPPVFLDGVPVNIPNTDLYSTFSSQYCYYVDPQLPGTPQNPNIVGSTGGGCSKANNGALTKPIAIFDLAISREFAHRFTLGIEIHNLLNNTANYPYYNPGYVNNGFGYSGPGSGTNPAFGLPGAVSSYPSTPFFSYPSGASRQFTVYMRAAL